MNALRIDDGFVHEGGSAASSLKVTRALFLSWLTEEPSDCVFLEEEGLVVEGES